MRGEDCIGHDAAFFATPIQIGQHLRASAMPAAAEERMMHSNNEGVSGLAGAGCLDLGQSLPEPIFLLIPNRRISDESRTFRDVRVKADHIEPGRLEAPVDARLAYHLAVNGPRRRRYGRLGLDEIPDESSASSLLPHR